MYRNRCLTEIVPSRWIYDLSTCYWRCTFFYSRGQYEEFELPKQVKGQADEGFADDASTPESLPSPERPPLRHVDKYCRPECPCLSKRMTVAVLTCFGFIIMFGMRCNMGMAKLRSDKGVSNKIKQLRIFLCYLKSFN